MGTPFNYVPREPQADRASFELLRGSVRLVSGAVGSRNPGVVALKIPQATLSPRGTDFMGALVNPAYLKVLQGAVAVTNGGGTVVSGASIGKSALWGAWAALLVGALASDSVTSHSTTSHP